MMTAPWTIRLTWQQAAALDAMETLVWPG